MKKIKSKNKPRTRRSSVRGMKVIIAMSGGIDSSVAAALLKEAGFCHEPGRRVDVIGVFMKFWAERDKDGLVYVQNRCCTPESEKRARAVAAKLDIPFYVFNFEKEFKKKVVDYFLKNYKLGLTPNPCVVCNKEIKFKLLLKKVMALEADYIATGHYARKKDKKLLKGIDKEKDQSYFLWQINQKILKKILFPVGNYTKTEVRKLARRFKLPVLDIPESQEICFIETTINDFLKKHLKAKPGSIIDPKGKIIGRHQGLHFYTIGQRKGIPIVSRSRILDKVGIKLPGGPFYVLDKDIKRNLLIVTKNQRDLYKKELFVKNINWISDVRFPLRVMAKIRYRHKSASAIITKQKSGKIKVIFSKPQRAITPGQSVVFYKGQEVLGGGIILNL